MDFLEDLFESHPGKVLMFGTFLCLGIIVCLEAWDPLTASTARRRATEDAAHFARVLHPAWTHPAVLCQAVDSDGNGYLSCTIGNGDALEPIECAPSVLFDYARGCRPVRFLTAPTTGTAQ